MKSNYQTPIDGNHGKNRGDDERDAREPTSLQAIEIVPANHLPADYDPRHIAYFELLQACERLEIPLGRWPRVTGCDPVLLPPETLYAGVPPFFPPPVDIWNAEEWPARADALWRAHRDRIADFHRQFIIAGLSRQRRARGSGPKRPIASAQLASEWAARHYCLRESWVSIYRTQPAHTYSPDQIRKNGGAILTELGIRQ